MTWTGRVCRGQQQPLDAVRGTMTGPCTLPLLRAGATQLVLEELLMTDVQMHPFELLSWEGVFGTIFMVFALLTFNAIPGAYLGQSLSLVDHDDDDTPQPNGSAPTCFPSDGI